MRCCDLSQRKLRISLADFSYPRVTILSIVRLDSQSVMRRLIYSALLLVILCFKVDMTSAQDDAQDSTKKTHFLIEPYFMAPTMKGEIGVRQLPAAEVDANPGDIFDQLKFAAMIYVEVNYDNKWSVGTDLIYMKLEQDIKPNALITSGKSTAQQLAFEFAFLKRLGSVFDVGIGGRVMDMKADLDLNTINGVQSGDSRQTWMDPILIVRSQGAINDKWLLQFRGDIGGFGIGSDFTWQIQANAGYQFSRLVSATIGYRVLDVDFHKGDGSENFSYDMAISGPVLRVGFRWE